MSSLAELTHFTKRGQHVDAALCSRQRIVVDERFLEFTLQSVNFQTQTVCGIRKAIEIIRRDRQSRGRRLQESGGKLMHTLVLNFNVGKDHVRTPIGRGASVKPLPEGTLTMRIVGGVAMIMRQSTDDGTHEFFLPLLVMVEGARQLLKCALMLPAIRHGLRPRNARSCYPAFFLGSIGGAGIAGQCPVVGGSWIDHSSRCAAVAARARPIPHFHSSSCNDRERLRVSADGTNPPPSLEGC